MAGPTSKHDATRAATREGDDVVTDEASPAAPEGRSSDADAAGRDTSPGGGRLDGRLTLSLAVGVAGGLLLAGATSFVFGRARMLVIDIVVALFISFGLEPAVKWLNVRGMRRGLATGLVFLLATLAFLGFIAAMLPLIIDQVSNLVANGQRLVNGVVRNIESLPGELGTRLGEWVRELGRDLPSQLPGMAQTAGRGVLDVGVTFVGSVFNMLTIALLAFYMTADAPRMRRVLSSRMPARRQREFLDMWDIAIEKMGGYLYSRVLTAIVSALFHTAVFALIGLEYAVALGAWVGVISSVVPVVGTYLAGLLPLVIALAGSVGDALWVLGAVTFYQQVENYWLAPRITAHTLSMHPAVAFTSVLLGAVLFGATGALLAIPATAIVAALLSARGETHEVVDHAMTRGPRKRAAADGH